MKILFFTEISIFPPNGGEQIRTYNILKAMSKLGYHVTAVFQNKENTNLEKYKLSNIKFVDYQYSEPTLLGLISAKNYFATNKKVINIFKNIMITEMPDTAFLDYNIAGRFCPFFKKHNIPVIIDTHNSQSNLYRQITTKNFIQFVRKVQHVLFMRIHEKYFYKMADALVVVSKEDFNFHNKFIDKSKIFIIPNFIDEMEYKMESVRENYFVMPANYGAYMNFEGLKWLLTKVWDNSIDSTNRLILVGKKSKEAFDQINTSNRFNNIKAIGMVDDIKPYIAKSKAVIVPLHHGSGSRLKCIEAMALKTPIISTSKGAEGIESKNIIIADEVIEFKNKITQFTYDSMVGLNLHNEFLENYSVKINSLRIKKIVEMIGDTAKNLD